MEYGVFVCGKPVRGGIPQSRLRRASPLKARGPRGRGVRIATTSLRTGLAMTHLQGLRYKPGSGRCGERTERCQWQRERSERVAAVKISSVRRKAAQKFWAPQQDHRPLRGVQGVQWAGDRKGRPYEKFPLVGADDPVRPTHELKNGATGPM